MKVWAEALSAVGISRPMGRAVKGPLLCRKGRAGSHDSTLRRPPTN